MTLSACCVNDIKAYKPYSNSQTQKSYGRDCQQVLQGNKYQLDV